MMINVDACVCLQLKMDGVGPSDDDHSDQTIEEDNDEYSMSETESSTTASPDEMTTSSDSDDSIGGINRELFTMK